jgi:hypothetical protein
MSGVIIYLYNKQVLVGSFGDWWSFAVNEFLALWDNIYECVYYNRCHGNAVEGFCALWNNIYDYACILPHIFSSFLTGNLLVKV